MYLGNNGTTRQKLLKLMRAITEQKMVFKDEHNDDRILRGVVMLEKGDNVELCPMHASGSYSLNPLYVDKSNRLKLSDTSCGGVVVAPSDPAAFKPDMYHGIGTVREAYLVSQDDDHPEVILWKRIA